MKIAAPKMKILFIFITLCLIFLLNPHLQAQISFGSLESEMAEKLVKVSSVFSNSSAKPGGVYQAAVIVDIQPHWHINSIKPFQDWLIPAELAYDTTSQVIPYEIRAPKALSVDLLGEKMSVYDDRVIFVFNAVIADDASVGQTVIPIRFTYQACNDKECRAPETLETDLSINIGDEGNPINTAVFASAEADKTLDETESTPAPEQTDLEKLINEYGFWGYFLALGLAFITGLLLSFSPCTYPMIPITVSIFAGQERSVGKGFIMSLFYVGSMAVVYGIMGLIVSLVGGVFGAWLASPAVVIGIAIVFVIFSLSMFGLYELQVPAFLRNKLGTAQTSGGITGSIILGIVAALVVSPCVGPFVAGILLYIATYGSPVFGFITLFVFAIGLGTLYLIIGTFSSAISALPGAGTWMETVKKFFGFVLLIMAIYFLRTVLSPDITAILTGLLLIAFGVFGGGLDRLTVESVFFDRLKKFLGILAFLIGIYLLLGTMISSGFILPPISKWLPASSGVYSQEEEKLIDWQTDLESGLVFAKVEQKPVLIDTWATWCVNCRVLEKKTFGNIDVANEAKRFVPLKIQLEKSGSRETIDFMTRFGLKQYSLPTTLLLDSKGNVKKVMQGVVNPEDMIAEMQKVK